MITQPGAAPGERIAVLHGHRVDLHQGADGLWTAALHRAPHRALCRPAPLGTVLRRLGEWSAPELDRLVVVHR